MFIIWVMFAKEDDTEEQKMAWCVGGLDSVQDVLN